MDEFVIWFALRVMSGISDVVFVADRMPMVCRTDWSRENEWNVGSGFVECCLNWKQYASGCFPTETRCHSAQCPAEIRCKSSCDVQARLSPDGESPRRRQAINGSQGANLHRESPVWNDPYWQRPAGFAPGCSRCHF